MGFLKNTDAKFSEQKKLEKELIAVGSDRADAAERLKVAQDALPRCDAEVQKLIQGRATDEALAAARTVRRDVQDQVARKRDEQRCRYRWVDVHDHHRVAVAARVVADQQEIRGSRRDLGCENSVIEMNRLAFRVLVPAVLIPGRDPAHGRDTQNQ